MENSNKSWLLIEEALARGAADDLIDRFDEAWYGESPPDLVAVLATLTTMDWRNLAPELIKIDLEHRWRRQRCITHAEVRSSAPRPGISGPIPWHPRTEDYAACFPVYFEDASLLLDIALEEFRVRLLWGDQPSRDEFLKRFQSLEQASLAAALASVEQALLVRSIRTSHRSVNHAVSPSQPVRDQDQHSKRPAYPPALAKLAIGDDIDDFRLLNELGVGAFGRVFLAQQRSMQRLVALKVTERRSFESPVLSRLDHPGIVRVFDERTVDSLTLMYMQYVPGDTLRTVVDWRRAQGRTDLKGSDYLRRVDEVLREKGETIGGASSQLGLRACNWGQTVAWIGARLADALDHAHEAGVWHRDIKPENILLNAQGSPMLVDFNLSFGESVQGASMEDSFGGSLAYMSPEHILVLQGKVETSRVRESSDVYSLAVVLWELLVGRNPFHDLDGRKDAGTLQEFWNRRHEPLAGLESMGSIPGGLQQSLKESLDPDPNRRPTAKKLARQLMLSTSTRLDKLFYPAAGSWSHYLLEHPLRSLILLSLIPNLCVSSLSIWANSRLIVHNFDQVFFRDKEVPIINFADYSLGMLAGVWVLWPIAMGLSCGSMITEKQRTKATKRCLTAPLLAGIAILGLWVSSGLAFPLGNLLSEKSSVGPQDVVTFVVSQLLHGIIAATTTYTIVSHVAIRAFLPKLLHKGENRSMQRQLDRHAKQLSYVSGLLALTPLAALLSLAFSDQFDKATFVALAVVGFVGHTFTSILEPMTRTCIQTLRIALAPTSELLQASTDSINLRSEFSDSSAVSEVNSES